MDKRTSCLFER